MFSFLREIKDNVVAEASLLFKGAYGGSTTMEEWTNKWDQDDRAYEMLEKDETYLEALHDKQDPMITVRVMLDIIENNLEGLPANEIANKLSLWNENEVKTAILSYDLINFFRDNNYTAEQVDRIVYIADTHNEIKDNKYADKEILDIIGCSQDELNQSLAVVAQFNNTHMQSQHPFVMQPQTSSNQSSKASAKTNTKKTAPAAS